MTKRPTLHVGDVVRLSKKGLRIHARRRLLFDTMVVQKVYDQDSSDGGCRIACTYFAGKAHQAIFKRRELWFTGYNALNHPRAPDACVAGIQAAKVGPTSAVLNNDGRANCLKCKHPTVFVPGFGSGGYNICKNKSCEMLDR